MTLTGLACAFAALATLSASTETTLHNFGLPPLSGAHPYGGLTADSHGNLYGTTAQGGAYGTGVVFELDSKGRQTLLYAFQGGADGKTPNAGLVSDLEGNLYGTTTYGGTANLGVVYKIAPGGFETVLHSFTGSADGSNPYAALTISPEGMLFGTTTYGGAAGLGVVFMVDRTTGQLTVLHSFAGGTDGANPNTSLTIDRGGNLYGTTTNGGPARAGVVYKVDNTFHETVLYSFTGGSDGFYPWSGVIGDSAGNLYGTTSQALQSAGVIYKLDPAGNLTVLYTFAGSADGEYPVGNLLRNPAGDLYGTTFKGGTSNGVVFKLDASGNFTVIHRFTGADGSHPYGGLILNSKGHLCGTTTMGGAVSEGVVFTLDSAGNETVLYSFPGPGDGRQPSGVALDAADNLYGTTTGGGSWSHGTVYKLDTTGHETILYNFKGEADGGYPRSGVAVDTAGNLYGSATEGGTGANGVVYKVDTAGRQTVLHSFTFADGSSPNGVILDAQGNLYGTTPGGGSANAGVVFQVDAAGHYSVLFNFPFGANGSPEGNLARDSAGNLYGNTTGNTAGQGVIYKLDTTGHETVLYSYTLGAGGYNPYGGLTLDLNGNLYGTTFQGGATNNGVVFKLDTTGRYSVLYNFTGGADGAHPGAGVTIDLSGNLYGTTVQGGAANDGVAYMLDPSGQQTVLYSFSGSDGANPGQLIRNLAGKLFGTTSVGGKNNGGVAFRLTLQ